MVISRWLLNAKCYAKAKREANHENPKEREPETKV
jgi:hypothetical protein